MRRSTSTGTPRDPLDAVGPVRADALRGALEAGRALGDERLVDEAFLERDVQQAERERQVRAGRDLQVQVGAARGRRGARVDDDQPAAVELLVVEVDDRGRHRLGEVRADEQQHVGGGDVGQRERQPAVEPERELAGGRRRGHAEAAVVVDRGRAQRDARELAEQVGLLVRQPAAAEDADRIAAVARGDRAQLAGDAVERHVPAHRAQRRAARRRASAAMVRRCGVGEQLDGGPALLAEPAAARRDGQPAALGEQIHPALQRAVRDSASRSSAEGRAASTDGPKLRPWVARLHRPAVRSAPDRRAKDERSSRDSDHAGPVQVRAAAGAPFGRMSITARDTPGRHRAPGRAAGSTTGTPRTRRSGTSAVAGSPARTSAFSIFAEHLGFSIWVLWTIIVINLGNVGHRAVDPGAVLADGVAEPDRRGAADPLHVRRAAVRRAGVDDVQRRAAADPRAARGDRRAERLARRPAPRHAVLGAARLRRRPPASAAATSRRRWRTSRSSIPSGRKGFALGLNAAGGNLGVAVDPAARPARHHRRRAGRRRRSCRCTRSTSPTPG